MALPTYFGSASNPADAGSVNEPVTSAVTPPGSMTAGDLVFLIGALGVATTGQMSISATGGQTWNSLGETAANNQCMKVWWAEYNGTWSADPSIVFSAQSGTIPTTVVMHVFRPGSASEEWAVDQAYTGAGFTVPSSVAAFSAKNPGQTTTKDNAVTFVGWLSNDDNQYGTPFIHDIAHTQGTTASAATSGIGGGTAGSLQTNPCQAVGQSFTAVNAYDLDSITLRFTKTGSPTDNVYIELYSGSITGTLVATSDNVAASGITNDTEIAFNFSSKPSLSAGTKYYMQILRSGARDASNYVSAQYSTASSLADGGLYSKTNNSWSSESSTNDIRLITTPVALGTWTKTGNAQYRNNAGSDHSCVFAHFIPSGPGNTFGVAVNQTALAADDGVTFIVSLYSAASGTTGTLAATTAGISLAATGTETMTGTIAATLAGISSSVTGVVDAVGTFSATFAGVSLAVSATETISGALSSTLTGVSLAASGAETISGTIAAAFSSISLASTGTETMTGTLASTFGGMTTDVAGAETFTATAAATLANISLAATGVVDAVGTLDSTLAGLTTTITATETITGTLASTLSNLTADASGAETMTGPLSATFGGVTFSGSGVVDAIGTLSFTLSGLVLASSGTETITGTLSSTFASIALDAAGEAEDSTTTGTLAATFSNLTSSFSGTETFTGTLSASFGTLALSSSGVVDAVGALAATLAPVTSAISGAETMTATLAATFAGVTFSGAGWAEATGTLVCTLGNLSSAISGAETMTGTAAGTLGGLALSASGYVSALGSLAATFGNVTCTGTGTETITGTLASTFGGISLAATSIEAIIGALSAQFSNAILAATGTASGLEFDVVSVMSDDVFTYIRH